MNPLPDIFAEEAEKWATAEANGTWKPAPSDPLYNCPIVRAGFRAFGLEAPPESSERWKLVLSRLDFGDSNPSALLTVYAPGHAAAFPNLADYVFSHTIGTNGGTNFNQCITRLSTLLGGNKNDWDRRITYLIASARQMNAGASNGTFTTSSIPKINEPPPFVFSRRIREGRTMSIFGPGSAGKTTIADGLIVSACSGKEIIPAWRPLRPYTSLLLDWDEGREEEEVRLSAICRAYSVKLDAGYHYKRMARPLHDVADEIGSYIVNNKVEIVVVSPVGRATRDHGDNITAPVDELYEILRSFNTTNILIDHVTGANMKGGAEREFGAVRKRDNVRGSFSLYPQSEEVGERVIVMRNTKPDALSPKIADQAVRIEYDPIDPDDGIYETIRFLPDEVVEQRGGEVEYGGGALRDQIRAALTLKPLSVADIAAEIGAKKPSVERVLYRYRDNWFGRLASGRWELLPAGRA